MKSFTVEWVSNMLPLIVTQIIHYILLQTFFRNKLISKENGRLQLQNYLILPCTEGKFFDLDEATPNTKLSDYYTLDPGLYLSISDFVNEMNNKFRNVKSVKKHQSDYTLTKLHSAFL